MKGFGPGDWVGRTAHARLTMYDPVLVDGVYYERRDILANPEWVAKDLARRRRETTFVARFDRLKAEAEDSY